MKYVVMLCLITSGVECWSQTQKDSSKYSVETIDIKYIISSVVKISDIQLPGIADDSLVETYYDRVTDRTFRFFYNRTEEYHSGTLKYPLDAHEGDEVKMPVFHGGILTENGVKHLFEPNETMVCAYNNHILTRLKDYFKGTTRIRSYHLDGGALQVKATQEFPSPFVYPIVTNEGRYIMLIEGEETNGNFVVFDYLLNHQRTYTPFIPNGFTQYDIESDGGITSIATCTPGKDRTIVKKAFFDDQFNLILEDSMLVLQMDTSNYAMSFGEMHYRGDYLMYAPILFAEGRNIKILCAYDKTGEIIWKRNYSYGNNHRAWDCDSKVFAWNNTSKKMLASLYDTDQSISFIGVFNEPYGNFTLRFDWRAWYVDATGKGAEARATPYYLKWLDGSHFIAVIGEIVKRGKTIDYRDNMLLWGDTDKGTIEKIDSIEEPVHTIVAKSNKNKIKIITNNKIYTYEIR